MIMFDSKGTITSRLEETVLDSPGERELTPILLSSPYTIESLNSKSSDAEDGTLMSALTVILTVDPASCRSPQVGVKEVMQPVGVDGI
jgi:hypothetical protein